jgi:hypothetical protein
MTIATPKTAQLNRRANPLVLAFLCLPLAVFFGEDRSRPVQGFLAALVLSAPMLLFTGCGDRVRTGANVATPTKSYTVTVTGTALDNGGATLRHTAVVTLIIQAAS